MKILSQAREAFDSYKRTREYGNAETARMIQRNLGTMTYPLRPSEGMISCDALSLLIDPARHEYVLAMMPALHRLAKAGGRFERDERGDPVLVFGEAQIRLGSADDINHAFEIFVHGIYDISTKQDALVLDIGMNVGVAALFFATVKGWEVVGCEPFPDTFESAARNVAASGQEGRIELRNVALSDRQETRTLPYDPVRSGRNGLFFEQAYGETLANTREVQVEDAANVVEAMRSRAGGRSLIVKMDCEGAEYAIFDRLAETGLLSAIDAILMEYHPFVPGRGPGDLRKALVDADFLAVTSEDPAEGFGLLWAVRSPASPVVRG